MTRMNSPFLIVNVRSYLYDEELLKLARAADEVIEDTGLLIYFTRSYTDLHLLKEHTRNLIIMAQFMDPPYPGRGMGHVLLDTLRVAGASAVFLNHAENSGTVSGLYAVIKWAKELGMMIIVRVDPTAGVRALACMDPDALLMGPTDLVDTGTAADDPCVAEAVKGIKEANPHVLATISSGISTADDCYNVIRLGANGTGAISGILKALSPELRVREMAEAIVRAQQEKKEQ